MTEKFIKFAEAPDRGSYLEIRAALIDAGGYDPYSQELDRAIDLAEQDKLAEARDIIVQSIWNLLLSPSAHIILAMAAEQAGEAEQAAMERQFAYACLTGILATGDGSRDKPYLVVRTSDEYDVLDFLRKQSERQTLHKVGDRSLDALRCSDGSEVWFDISDAYNQMVRELEGAEGNVTS